MTDTTTTPRPRLNDGDMFTHAGRIFTARFEQDEEMREPWLEHDGHGIISEWRPVDTQRRGELVLCRDRNSARFYDIPATRKLAQKDGWGCSCPPKQHRTAIARRNCAVQQDYERMRAWCEGEWTWMIVTVEDDATGEKESLCGIDGDVDNYLTEVAYELADELASRLATQEAHELTCLACKGTGKVSA